MDGLTLFSLLQQRQIAVRAIIVSAYGDITNIRTATNRGAFDPTRLTVLAVIPERPMTSKTVIVDRSLSRLLL